MSDCRWRYRQVLAVKLLRHERRLGETRLQGRRPLQAVSLFIYLFKHRRQRAKATYMPVKSIQRTYMRDKQ